MNTLKPDIYLAPFQGITTATYRKVYAGHFKGVEKIYTPFFTAIHKHKSLSAKAEELAITHIAKTKIIPQVLSKDADEMLRFASYCEAKGHDEINWNLGCPYPRVANKKRGSGLLMHPQLIGEILEKIEANTDIHWSVKCRLGYLSPEEILELAPIFNDSDLIELIIHARIGKQLYKGSTDLKAFQSALDSLQLPVVYNGDVFSVEDFKALSQQFDVSGWMIGRGLLVDPFLPAILLNFDLPPIAEQQLLIRKFIEDLYLTYRKQMNDRPQAINVLKELWSFMAYGFDKPQRIFNAIKKTNSFDAYETVVARVFSEHKWVGSAAELYKKSLLNDQIL